MTSKGKIFWQCSNQLQLYLKEFVNIKHCSFLVDWIMNKDIHAPFIIVVSVYIYLVIIRFKPLWKGLAQSVPIYVEQALVRFAGSRRVRLGNNPPESGGSGSTGRHICNSRELVITQRENLYH